MNDSQGPTEERVHADAATTGRSWPPNLSAHRLFTVGIIFISLGVLAGEWIMPAVAAAVSDALGPTAHIGSVLVFGLTDLLTKLLLPLGISMVSASLVIRALDTKQHSSMINSH